MATKLIDIYEAAGAAVSEDRSMVSMVAGQIKPFDILLEVYPENVTFDGESSEKVTFNVLLRDELSVTRGTYAAAELRHIEHSASIELPVDQVRIAPRRKSVNTVAELSELPAGTVIMGPEFHSEVYQCDGKVWHTIGSEPNWLGVELVHRGPFQILHMGEVK